MILNSTIILAESLIWPDLKLGISLLLFAFPLDFGFRIDL
jgi:hypothetical protein